VNRHRSTSLVPVELLLVIGALVSALVVWVALTSRTYSDFVVWYEAAQALQDGRDLYFSDISQPGFRNMNPPQQVVLTAPLAWLPIREALIAWWLVTAASMYGCVRLWRSALPRGWPAAVFALLLVSAAGYLNIRAANQSWVTAWAVTWGWILWRRQQVRRGACLLGAMASMKLFLLILLPYFAWRRQWSSVAFFMTGVVAAFTLGLIVAGPQAFSSWLSALKEQAWQGQALSMSLLGGATRALQPSTEFQPLVARPSAVLPVWLAASVLVSSFAGWRLRAERNSDRDLAAILTLMLLLTPSGWVYYIPLAAGPVAAAAAVSSSRTRSLWIAGVVALLFPYHFTDLGQPSAWATVTVGSIYMWGGLFVLTATLVDAAARPGAPSIEGREIVPSGSA
jgi:hypothetical protein